MPPFVVFLQKFFLFSKSIEGERESNVIFSKKRVIKNTSKEKSISAEKVAGSL